MTWSLSPGDSFVFKAIPVAGVSRLQETIHCHVLLFFGESKWLYLFLTPFPQLTLIWRGMPGLTTLTGVLSVNMALRQGFLLFSKSQNQGHQLQLNCVSGGNWANGLSCPLILCCASASVLNLHAYKHLWCPYCILLDIITSSDKMQSGSMRFHERTSHVAWIWGATLSSWTDEDIRERQAQVNALSFSCARWPWNRESISLHLGFIFWMFFKVLVRMNSNVLSTACDTSLGPGEVEPLPSSTSRMAELHSDGECCSK